MIIYNKQKFETILESLKRDPDWEYSPAEEGDENFVEMWTHISEGGAIVSSVDRRDNDSWGDHIKVYPIPNPRHWPVEFWFIDSSSEPPSEPWTSEEELGEFFRELFRNAECKL
jgi:hypothetical protein